MYADEVRGTPAPTPEPTGWQPPPADTLIDAYVGKSCAGPVAFKRYLLSNGLA